CGAGLLDAGAAVAAVATLTANVYAPVAPVAQQTISLDGSGSVVVGGKQISSYAWAIGSGSNASFTGATNGPTASLVATSAGAVSVSLTVTDSAGQSDTTSTTLSVAAAPQTSSGGGGALEPWWLAGLLAATLILIGSSTRSGSRIRQTLRRARRSSTR
ncbi:MAG TPA: PKD domain-containing protein, partial [Burkholderiaceae bacterium]|nr:PKD domain-containing protein [Burkholderiaceae bacterium]